MKQEIRADGTGFLFLGAPGSLSKRADQDSSKIFLSLRYRAVAEIWYDGVVLWYTESSALIAAVKRRRS